MLNSVLAVMLAMSLLGSMRPAMKLSMDLAIGSGRLFLASLAADLMPSVIGFLALRLKRISGQIKLTIVTHGGFYLCGVNSDNIINVMIFPFCCYCRIIT